MLSVPEAEWEHLNSSGCLFRLTFKHDNFILDPHPGCRLSVCLELLFPAALWQEALDKKQIIPACSKSPQELKVALKEEEGKEQEENRPDPTPHHPCTPPPLDPLLMLYFSCEQLSYQAKRRQHLLPPLPEQAS